jgi:hypothetical protein
MTKFLSHFTVALVSALPLAGPTKAEAATFPGVVRQILDSQTDGRLARMGPNQRARMTDCVISALSGLPNGQKRYIVDGSTLDEQQDRFGEVVEADRAKWKQAIARACSSIAMGGSSND